MARIKHIALTTANPSAAAEFYKSAFGLKELRRSPMMCHLLDALEAGTDIGEYGRLTVAMVAHHFVDPDQLVNPGKVMPTPRLCGEVPGPYRRHPLEAAGVAERF